MARPITYSDPEFVAAHARKLRHDERLTIRTIADRLGVSENVVSRLVRGMLTSPRTLTGNRVTRPREVEPAAGGDDDEDSSKAARRDDRIHPGHPITWDAILVGTCLEGTPYPE